ncbi:MAG: LamG-like jellyroll fold domain-containing protein [Bacteroidales bacterium]
MATLDGNINDLSGNLYNGTITGSYYINDRFGIYQHALQIVNNSDALVLPQQINLPNTFTLACWVKIPINNSLNCVLPQRDVAGAGIDDWSISIWNGQLITQIDWTGCSQPYLYSKNTHLNDTIWHHIVFIADRGTNGVQKMYIDGVIDTSRTVPLGTFSNNNIPISIPQGNESIDDIGIWNRVLTQNEISALYNAGLCYQTITVTDTLIINANLTGFNPIVYKNTVKIFPNPTNDHITIDFGSNFSTMNGYTLQITNSLSQIVYTTIVNQQQKTVDLSTWTGNGIYFVHLIDAQSNTIDIRKIVLQ